MPPLPAKTWMLLAGWDPLGWLHETGWYQALLDAPWFRPVRTAWIRYRLDLVAAGLLLLLIVLIAWKSAARTRRRAAHKRLQSNPLRAARQHLKDGDKRLAAESFRQAGRLERAFELFVEEESWHDAARVAEELGRYEQAAELFRKGQDPGGELEMWRRAGELGRAEAIYRELDQPADAARMYEQAGEVRRAAEVYREIGLDFKAAALLESAGERLEAAEILLAIAGEAGSYTTDEIAQIERAARRLAKEKRQADAGRLLRLACKWEPAASAFEKAGQPADAATCFEQAGHLQRAADLYREVGDDQSLYRVVKRIRQDGGAVDPKEWARLLRAAGFHHKASEVYRELGDVDAAVEASLQGQQPHEAAELLAERGEHAEAARLFLEAGDPAAAREQYLAAADRAGAARAAMTAGAYFEAGVDFLATGDNARAVDALQRVEEKHPRYREASSLLAQAFDRLGDRQMARRMHERAVDAQSMTQDNLELFYQLARFLEKAGTTADRRRARDLYADILAVQYTFRDTKRRHDDLTEKIDGDVETQKVAPDSSRFGDYLPVERIGSGGMAEVHKAVRLPLKQPVQFVALKRLLPDLSDDQAFIRMLEDEARIAVHLDHPAIARLLDYGWVAGKYYLAVEYVAGKNLRRIWSRWQREGLLLPIGLSVYVVEQVCRALDHAHAQKNAEGVNLEVIHRDVSPENVMISYAGEVKLIDFGIAKAANRATSTRTGILKGKFAYMSPEQVRGLPLDGRSDIFSTGILLHELLTGRYLFRTDSDAAMIEMVRNAVVEPPSSCNPAVPQELDALVLQALAKDPDERFSHAGAMQQALAVALSCIGGFERDKLAAFMKRHYLQDMEREHQREQAILDRIATYSAQLSTSQSTPR